LNVRQLLQYLNLIAPILHAGLQRSMLSSRQSPLLFASEQLMPYPAAVGMGVAQVRSLDKTEGAMPS
jgi:hypothetical protein